MYQAIYAVFAVAIIVAAMAQRVKWRTLLRFAAPWVLLVYCPVVHMVWGANGLMNGLWNGEAKIPALDFAGGLVVHVAAGWSVLVFGLVLGLRPRWGRVPDEPHSIMRIIVGTALLWIGWLGFSVGFSSDLDPALTGVATARTMAAAVGGLVWVVLDVMLKRPLPLRGFCLGIISGLVAISAADGFVTNTGAAIITLIASGAAYVCANYLTTAPGFELARKVFAIHGGGGAVGVALTGLLADASANSNLARVLRLRQELGMSDRTFDHPLFLSQLGALLVTLLVAAVGTFVIAFTLKAISKRPRPAGGSVPA
jgi:Amt family ammonium transporter